jgi:hypothetical protein
LQAGIFVQRGVGWVRDRDLIGHLFVVPFPRHGRTKIDHLAGVCIDQQQVLDRMGLLLTAVMLLLLGGVDRPLATAVGAVNR